LVKRSVPSRGSVWLVNHEIPIDRRSHTLPRYGTDVVERH